MDVTSVRDSTDFARKVLQGVAAIELPRQGEIDLCLELGLSLWMRQTGTELDDAGPAMVAMRSALLLASGLDPGTEPIPLRGVDPRLDALNLGTYLRRLMARATSRARCDTAVMVERALEHLGNGRFRAGRISTLAAG
jgi:hypothetical protein